MTPAALAGYFRGLDPHTRSLALVGGYLQSWALMELELDDGIAKALGLTGLQRYVIRSNMPFHNKISVMKTLVHLSWLSDTQKTHYDDALNSMLGYSSDRNIIAHDAFSSSNKNDGVQFLVYRAKGKMQFPEFNWSVNKFVQQILNLDQCAKEMADLHEKIDKITTSSLAAILAAAPSPIAPNLGFGG